MAVGKVVEILILGSSHLVVNASSILLMNFVAGDIIENEVGAGNLAEDRVLLHPNI
jgi:hypothetical protein